MRKRRRFTEEFKQHAVEMANQAGVTKRQIADELGIDAKMLGRWWQELSSHGSKAFPGVGKARDEEQAEFRRELARVKKERDSLIEAAAFFARVEVKYRMVERCRDSYPVRMMCRAIAREEQVRRAC